MESSWKRKICHHVLIDNTRSHCSCVATIKTPEHMQDFAAAVCYVQKEKQTNKQTLLLPWSRGHRWWRLPVCPSARERSWAPPRWPGMTPELLTDTCQSFCPGLLPPHALPDWKRKKEVMLRKRQIGAEIKGKESKVNVDLSFTRSCAAVRAFLWLVTPVGERDRPVYWQEPGPPSHNL